MQCAHSPEDEALIDKSKHVRSTVSEICLHDNGRRLRWGCRRLVDLYYDRYQSCGRIVGSLRFKVYMIYYKHIRKFRTRDLFRIYSATVARSLVLPVHTLFASSPRDDSDFRFDDWRLPVEPLGMTPVSSGSPSN